MKKVYQRFLLLVIIPIAVTPSFAQTANSSLPVLITIDANLTSNNKVTVVWTLLQKVSTDYFDVEKSGDGFSWHSIATVKANNSAAIPCTYSQVDESPMKGSNFYRIRSKDFNGIFAWTLVKSVRVNTGGMYSLYPNPSTEQVNISLGQMPVSDWQVAIFNSMGQVMVQKKYNKNTTAVSLPVKSYPAGIYTLEITNNLSRQRNRLLINHN